MSKPIREMEPRTAREYRKEYRNWQLEIDRHYLEVTHIGVEGESFTDSPREYEYAPHPLGFSTQVSVPLMPEDVKLEIVPFHWQVYKKRVSLKQPDGIIKEFAFGIRNDRSISFIAIRWENNDGVDRIGQYFFRDDEPAGPSWPLNGLPIVIDAMLPFFTAFGKLHPEVSDSLTRCTELLATPGKESSTDH